MGFRVSILRHVLARIRYTSRPYNGASSASLLLPIAAASGWSENTRYEKSSGSGGVAGGSEAIYRAGWTRDEDDDDDDEETRTMIEGR